MSFWKKSQRTTEKINDSRINLIIAIIFLLAGLVIYRLIDLQVLNYDLYFSKAAGLHQIYSELQPARGRIFILDSASRGDNGLYPIATNKNFALLYAVPKDVAGANKISQALYAVFDREKVEQEVEALLKKEDEDRLKQELNYAEIFSGREKADKIAEINDNHQRLLSSQQFLETREIRREAEINLRKEKNINGYLEKLKKPEDIYEPLKQKVDEETLKRFYLDAAERPLEPGDLEIDEEKWTVLIKGEAELKIAGIGFSLSPFRFYPEGSIGSNLIGFVGYAGDKQQGRYGLEEFFDHELSGLTGSIKVERDAKGNPIIINDREYNQPEDGSDLILTIDRSIQFAACNKLNQAVAGHGADGGSVIIMNPKSGAIIAMCSGPDYDGNNFQQAKDIKVFTNPAIFDQYEPGSIFKVLTMAMALDQGKVTPRTVYDDTGQVIIDKYTIKNSDLAANGQQTMNQVLEKSLNTGAIFAMRSIGPELFADYVKAFGFGEKTGIELEGESRGDIKNLSKKPVGELYAATASFGQGLAVTPIQMVTAFAAIANDGLMMMPYLVKEIIKPDGQRVVTEPKTVNQVISEKAAAMIGGMMVNVVENGHGQKAGVTGYWVGGKTGTAQVPRKDGRGYQSGAHIGSFAGFAPADDPKFVMLVRIDNPRDVEWAESSAAPLFGELAEFMLNYWQVPKERSVEIKK
ncbi:MAG: penicillin-binding protein 2 [bacterium]|nr:penicillin-binding protein 2 [bacterium]